MPITVKYWPARYTWVAARTWSMPSVCAATAPRTTAGYLAVGADKNVPAATLPPRVASSPGWAASTEMPPLSTAGTAAVRRTVAPGTYPVAVTDSTGGMRAIIGSAVSGSGAGEPSKACPALTVSRFPSAPSWASRFALDEAEMPRTATAAAIPIAMPRQESAVRSLRARSPRQPPRTRSAASPTVTAAPSQDPGRR